MHDVVQVAMLDSNSVAPAKGVRLDVLIQPLRVEVAELRSLVEEHGSRSA
jgi:hypothetical protein